MRLKLGHKSKGSMLLEAAIAMTIIAICLAISFAHTSSLLRSDKTAIKLKAKMAFDDVIDSPNLKEEAFSYEGFQVIKSVSAYKGNDNLVLITLTAVDEDDKVFLESKHLKKLSVYE